MTQQQHREVCNQIKDARIHLKYLCDKALQRNENVIDHVTELRVTENLTSVIKVRRERPLEDFFLAFIYRSEDQQITHAMAHLLLLLVGDAAISSVVPFTYHYDILQTYAAIRNNVDFTNKLNDMK